MSDTQRACRAICQRRGASCQSFTKRRQTTPPARLPSTAWTPQRRTGDVHQGPRLVEHHDAFATNTRVGGPGKQLPDLELRHQRRARCEDRIRVAKDTGLRAFPLFDFAQNQIWCAIVALDAELTAWMQMLALHDHDARRWEPKRLRLRLFTVPATLARPGRRVLLHLAGKAPWAGLARQAITRLRALAAPG